MNGTNTATDTDTKKLFSYLMDMPSVLSHYNDGEKVCKYELGSNKFRFTMERCTFLFLKLVCFCHPSSWQVNRKFRNTWAFFLIPLNKQKLRHHDCAMCNINRGFLKVNCLTTQKAILRNTSSHLVFFSCLFPFVSCLNKLHSFKNTCVCRIYSTL